uniref:Uncharacterized protein n=1 Tax=Candidatus Kentrum sp. TUN TaxID=2126343 RepID=A0A451A7Y1_9GAMM|nr:MAG: hypothetical protein BECKTUN1418D_GA0071000_116810 [Candidatus Kentron sp. TUN]
MKNKSKMTVIYCGPALSNHSMEISDLAPALLAFSEIIKKTGVILGADREKIAVSVSGSFKSGSFGFDVEVSQKLIEQAALFFSDKNLIEDILK